MSRNPQIPTPSCDSVINTDKIICPDKHFDRYVIFGENVEKASETYAASVSRKIVSRKGI
jgi:hypothetical protein